GRQQDRLSHRRGRSSLPLAPIIHYTACMLSIGSTGRSEDLVGLLLECHERIRRFSTMALEVGRRRHLPAAEVLEAARRRERYVRVALPLHVADEEVSVEPRLDGLDAAVDAALETMEEQHRAHEPLLRELLEALVAVQEAPADAGGRRRLHAVA